MTWRLLLSLHTEVRFSWYTAFIPLLGVLVLTHLSYLAGSRSSSQRNVKEKAVLESIVKEITLEDTDPSFGDPASPVPPPSKKQKTSEAKSSKRPKISTKDAVFPVRRSSRAHSVVSKPPEYVSLVDEDVGESSGGGDPSSEPGSEQEGSEDRTLDGSEVERTLESPVPGAFSPVPGGSSPVGTKFGDESVGAISTSVRIASTDLLTPVGSSFYGPLTISEVFCMYCPLNHSKLLRVPYSFLPFICRRLLFAGLNSR